VQEDLQLFQKKQLVYWEEKLSHLHEKITSLNTLAQAIHETKNTHADAYFFVDNEGGSRKPDNSYVSPPFLRFVEGSVKDINQLLRQWEREPDQRTQTLSRLKEEIEFLVPILQKTREFLKDKKNSQPEYVLVYWETINQAFTTAAQLQQELNRSGSSGKKLGTSKTPTAAAPPRKRSVLSLLLPWRR